MKKILIITLIVLGFAVSGIARSQAEVLNFDDLNLPGQGFTELETYSKYGFLIEDENPSRDDTVNFFMSPQSGIDTAWLLGDSYNPYLMVTWDTDWATLTKPGSSFTLNSIDLHGIPDYHLPTVEFFAYKDGESPISQQFALNDLDEWHTFNFDSRFQNVDSVKWQQCPEGLQYHAFDNIVLNNVVPEPISCVLFGVGGLTLAAFRRFRKK